MASTINAVTSGGGGVATTADSSGVLNLQSSGSTVASVSSTGVAVTGTLSATGAISSSSSITASGFDTASTFGFKNRIINGAMMIDQRNAGASVTPNNSYTLDRWVVYNSQTGKLTVQQNAGSVTPPAGFKNYLGVTSSSAYTVGTNEIFILGQAIEGFNTADLGFGAVGASTVTVSFWVRSSLTGTFGGCLDNSADNRTYPFSYTINSANTWEYKTVTIAGDTTGTWVGATNGAGIILYFSLGAGSGKQNTANTWAAGSYVAPTGAVNVVGTNGATFYITGVQLEKGSTATSFDYRPYGTELQLCQRYCFKMATTSNYGPYGMGHGTGGTTNFRAVVKTAQTMRAQPSLSFSAANTFQWGFGNVLTAISAAEYGTDAFSVGCDTTGVSSNGAYMLTSANNTTSYILATAEL